MRHSKRFSRLIDYAKKQESSAADEMQKARSLLDSLAQQLEQLRGFYHEYAQRQFAQSGKSYQSFTMMNHYAFLDQLESGVIKMQKQTELADKQYQHAHQVWLALHQKTESLSKLQERYIEKEKKVADALEQKMLDDWVQQVLSQHE